MTSDEGEWKLRCSIGAIGCDGGDGVGSNESSIQTADGGQWINRLTFVLSQSRLERCDLDLFERNKK